MKTSSYLHQNPEDERDFMAILEAHPGVSLEKQDLGQPMTKQEYNRHIKQAMAEADAGDVYHWDDVKAFAQT